MGKVNRTNTFRRLIWLLQAIYEASPQGITYNQISEKWSKETGLSQGSPYPGRTFRNHLKNIHEIFNITVKVNVNKYAIPYTESIDLAAMSVWMDYVKMKKMVSASPNLSERIFLGSEWSGNKNLVPVLTAIRDSVATEIRCQLDHAPKRNRHFVLHPYYLKLHKGSWYTVCYCVELSRTHVFLLDEIEIRKVTSFPFPVEKLPDKEAYRNDITFSKILSGQKRI